MRPGRLLHRRGPLRRGGLAAVLTLAAAAGVLLLAGADAAFTRTTAPPGSTLQAATLDGWLPTAVSATRTGATTCTVSWTPSGAAPGSATYDVTDGTGTVVTGASGTSAAATVPVTTVTPAVRLRVSTWTSASTVAAGTPCYAWPSAPGGLTLTPTTGQVVATWTAAAGNGGTVSGYTATISPVPGSGSATCSTSGTTCTWTGLTDGTTYTVSVTATTQYGTGPAATSTAIPYPSAVMTPAATKLWLDAAQTSSLLGAGCSGTSPTAVGCWKDRSTSGNDALQPTGSAQPALTGTLAGRTVPFFDGAGSTLALNPALLPTGGTASTVFAVAAETEASPSASGQRTVLSYGSAASGQARSLQKESLTAAMRASVSGSAVTDSSWTSSAGLVDGEFTSSSLTVWGNGRPGSTLTGLTNSTGTTYAALGANGTPAQFWYGPIGEVVVVTGTLTAADRRTVEEYLARKWSVPITPAPPTGVSGAATSPSSTAATVTWTAPAWNGGSAVTGYTVTAVPVAGGSTVTCTAAAGATSCALAGLAGGGAQYTVTVTAANAVGTGPGSTAVSLFSGVPSGANVKLWLAADDLDGNGVQAGTAESGVSSGKVATWKDKSGGGLDVTQSSSSLQPAFSSRTINGFAVPTFNGSAILSGDPSVASPYGITGDRSIFLVTRERTVDGTGTATDSNGSYLTSRPVSTNGLFALKDCSGTWSVQYRNDSLSGANNAACVSGGAAPSANRVDVVEGFRSGTTNSAWVSGAPGSSVSYSGTITQAPLSIGRHTSTTVTQDLDVAEVLVYSSALSGSARRAVEDYLAAKWGGTLAPDVPTGVSAVPTYSGQNVTVSWTAPVDTGGSAVTQYTARTTTGTTICTATAPATSCTGGSGSLTDGTSYSVVVTATNSVGTGEVSASAAVTPSSPAGAPTGLTVTQATDTTASVSWTAPSSTGGSAITGYTVTATTTDATLSTQTCTSATTSCTLGTLTPGAAWTFSVTATTAAGAGAASSGAVLTPYPMSVLTGSSTVALWLDGSSSTYRYSDTGCTTLAGTASGSAVACWKDRSGNARNATGAGSLTVGGTAMNGRTVLASSGGGQVTVPRPASGDMTMFAVVRTTASVGSAGSQWWAGAPVLDGDVSTVNSNDLGFTLVAGRPAFGTGNPDATASGPSAVNDGTARVVVGRRVGSTGALEASANGATRGSATSSNTGALTTQPSLYLGKGPNGSIYVGDYAELIVAPSALTTTDQRTISEYLARKWGGVLTPGAPSAVTATPGGSGAATVTWTSSWNGNVAGSATYTVTTSGGGTCAVSGTSATCTGVTAGSRTFTVTPSNSAGTGVAATAVATVG